MGFNWLPQKKKVDLFKPSRRNLAGLQADRYGAWQRERLFPERDTKSNQTTLQGWHVSTELADLRWRYGHVGCKDTPSPSNSSRCLLISFLRQIRLSIHTQTVEFGGQGVAGHSWIDTPSFDTKIFPSKFDVFLVSVTHNMAFFPLWEIWDVDQHSTHISSPTLCNTPLNRTRKTNCS